MTLQSQAYGGADYSCGLLSYPEFCCKFSPSFLTQLHPKASRTIDGFVDPPVHSTGSEDIMASVRPAARPQRGGHSSPTSWISRCPQGCSCYTSLWSLTHPIYMRFLSALGKIFFRADFPNSFSYWSSQSLGGLSGFSALQLRRKHLWALSHLNTVLQLQLSEHPHLPPCYQPVISGLRSKVPVTWK